MHGLAQRRGHRIIGHSAVAAWRMCSAMVENTVILGQVWTDYNFTTKKSFPSPLTLLTVLDGDSTALETLAVQDKESCRVSCVLRSDQEPAIMALADAIIKSRAEETTEQRGPCRDSQSKGPMEAAGGRAQGLLRVYVHTTEQHFGENMGPDCLAVAWPARHIGWILTR